ncbi:MAG: hypothetical protein JNL83_18495 [Myxococcales bacterium]|nr:hypothetical protein [Myxococcales bacterium]
MRAALALALVSALAGTATADADAAHADAWKATRGTLAPGRAPDSFVLSSDGAPGRYSEAGMITVKPVALPYTLEATWRRLGPEAGRSMHVLVAGGVVLIKNGAIAFYAYDAGATAFGQGDWKPLAGHGAQAEHAVKVTQTKDKVTVMLDGAQVAQYDLAIARDAAHVGFGMKSAPGYRSAIYLRDVTVVN